MLFVSSGDEAIHPLSAHVEISSEEITAKSAVVSASQRHAGSRDVQYAPDINKIRALRIGSLR